MKSPALALVFLFYCVSNNVAAQSGLDNLDRVLTTLELKSDPAALPVDEGAPGVWQRLLKLSTTGSVMHTTAHPDDEHAGLLTYLSRGEGHRLALLSLNRGEAGANAIGAELFDALGMVRTEELRRSGRYYGLDDLYFTTVTDYGYSKTLEESLRNWGRENVLRDMVRILRLNRPLVVISRFHGSTRDGHGNHQAAGGITPEAVAAAADPDRFPEQITEEGLRPWKVMRLYRGGIREGEPWDVQIDVGAYNPWIGDSYRNFGYYGLSLQRSQTGGRTRGGMGPAVRYYEHLTGENPVGGQSKSFFDGLDTSITGVFSLFGEEATEALSSQLAIIETEVNEAIENFSISHPEQAVAPLARGLEATRRALSMMPAGHEAGFLLRVKEAQFEDAIRAALGLQVVAIGVPGGMKQSESPWAPLPTMGAVVPGQQIDINFDFVNPTNIPITLKQVQLESSAGIEKQQANLVQGEVVGNQPVSYSFNLKIPDNATNSRLYFSRPTVSENRYHILDQTTLHTAVGEPALKVAVLFEVAGQTVRLEEKVYTRESDVPYGYRLDPLKIVPRFAVNASGTQVVPLGQQPASFSVEVEVINNDPSPDGVTGLLELEHPDGWLVEPSEIPVSFSSAGQRSMHSFKVTAKGLEARAYELTAQVISDGAEYKEGYERVKQRDLDIHYLYKPAVISVHGMDVRMTAGLNVGYVMGVGDEVPAAIEQLGASVSLLDEQALARSDLSTFDVIVVGTRAYAVRQDLLTYNQRLLDFSEAGGHLIVLYQTPEFVPDQMAAFPADLPRSSEEVSEEDSPVEILAPDHPVFAAPNKITMADFDGWIEQRGSKFFASWDDAYTPLIASYDMNQDPQAGGWLIAKYGTGTYTYFAYAIHRQTPFAVPGAYRIFANLLSLK